MGVAAGTVVGSAVGTGGRVIGVALGALGTSETEVVEEGERGDAGGVDTDAGLAGEDPGVAGDRPPALGDVAVGVADTGLGVGLAPVDGEASGAAGEGDAVAAYTQSAYLNNTS